jgi:lipid II:glycine glycyltransferase (peptidoglycan interpeptide bridge formation enzyme)
VRDFRAPLAAAGFSHEALLNYLIDLRPGPAALWANIKSNAQRNIRKAQKLGVTIEEAGDASRIAAAYALLKGVYRRLQVPLAEEALFQAAFDLLAPAGLFKVLLVRADRALAGALTLLLHKGTILYWYTGVDKEFAAYRAGDLLVWHVLAWGSANGYHTFDFGGAGRPDEPYGVRDFKAKFGGVLVDYGRDVCVHAPGLLRLSEAGYALLRRFL